MDVENSAQVQACGDPNSRPVANAGPDRNVNDVDGQPGESVVLDASASSDPDPGTELTYQWFDLDADKSLGPASTTPTLTVTLGLGTHNITLEVTDDSGDGEIGFANDDLVITISAPAVPIANAGADRNIPDSDGQPGESVTLDGSASTRHRRHDRAVPVVRGGSTSEISQLLGTGQTLTVPLPDGANDILLIVTDNDGNTGTDTSGGHGRGAAPPETVLSEIPNLTPNQQPDGEQARQHVRRARAARARRGLADGRSAGPAREVQRHPHTHSDQRSGATGRRDRGADTG